VAIDDGARLTWIRQPHYYFGFYPYTYAAGLTLANTVAQRFREEGQPAIDRWLQALKAGSTLKPLELAQLAGVDMASPDPIRNAVAYVGSLVDELEADFEAVSPLTYFLNPSGRTRHHSQTTGSVTPRAI